MKRKTRKQKKKKKYIKQDTTKHLYIRMAKIQGTEDTKYCQGCKAKENEGENAKGAATLEGGL